MRVVLHNHELTSKDIEPGLLRQRRNLFIFSLGLILYEWAGGDLTGISLGGVGITFKHPVVITAFAWFGLTYSLWRYWLHRGPALAQYEAELHHFLYVSNRFDVFWRMLLDERDIMKPNTRWKELYKPQLADTSSGGIQINFHRVFRHRVESDGWETNKQGDLQEQILELDGADLHEAREILREVKTEAILSGRWWGNYHLPYFVAGVAYLSGLWGLVRYSLMATF